MKEQMIKFCALIILVIFVFALCSCGQSQEMYSASTFAMDTMVTQQAYGYNAERAMREVNIALAEWEARLSMFKPESDIAKINGASGKDWVVVEPETADFLRQALELSSNSDGAFAITIAPITKAWGITTDTPRIPDAEEIEQLLPLVDDTAVRIEDNQVMLENVGMGIDLGGIAKGAACEAAKKVYEQYGIKSALLNIGGNVYAHATKPDGSAFRCGFRNPNGPSNSTIASFDLVNAVIAVSGGYERYFEEMGQKFIHIIDPRTGYPVESDIITVGVISEDGTETDFWSTTLFIQGVTGVLKYMRNGGIAIALGDNGTLYVSESLKDSFVLYSEEYVLEYIAQK